MIRFVFLFSFLTFNALSSFAQDLPVYIEEDGIIAIELESAGEYFDWSVDTIIDGYLGSSYLRYSGPNYFGSPGNSLLTFKINISTTGTYRFQWRSRIAQGNSNTDHNDNWLRIPDATAFYGKIGNSTVYPHGSGMTPTPNGAGSNGWFKVYQNQTNNWTWDASTSDNDPHPIFAEFDSAGIYTIEISGRSQGHAIDRFVLYHSSVSISDATWLGRPESQTMDPVGTNELTSEKLFLSPNPAVESLSINLPKENLNDSFEIQIYDTMGMLVKTFNKNKSEVHEKTILNISELIPGNYMVRIRGEKILYSGQFIKQN